jgi:hypothetical protein
MAQDENFEQTESELEKEDGEDVEAHRRRLVDEPSQDDEGDDVEAHRRR